ncbi:cytochrome c oxidase subunit II [Flavilitoribacter nigricans]|uniref:Cytochrome c oxidase subunit 2 n=1 Tax=Flavilitoribacter nigricans (strain ATCC 23147 / DSM 23189 / NBRC 102662 / NCIMB 1420 / SS-2) TaxID=1122177 RepID=A0A2D0N9F7_FLAN2|nr:cytochrome c oxidase subunit II [Flavilitoribacter nigricans]PHN05006.1 flagellar motor protein MotB [Flavilitoribacter nigricans DSM 23189 = NBRC 102662]
MTAILAILCVLLIGIVVVQIGKVTELAAKIRGEEEVEEGTNRRQSGYLMVFMVAFLIFTVVSALYYRNYMLGYGPHESASEHGGSLDSLFNTTLFFTGIVFIITQIALFYFAWKYRAEKGRASLYMPHDNKLEVIWTIIPAVVMTFLVVGGLDAWNEVMADIPEDAQAVLIPTTEDKSEFLEIEATGYQFAWDIRYPGADGLLGTKNFRMITGTNPLGQDWSDEKNHDDFMTNEIVLPKNRWVRVRITAKDVLHNFYLPHFRVKMDAIPGLPTYFVFKPTKTTEEYREQLSTVAEYQVPDPNDPEKMLWETFGYELACAELCGKGHFSMRRAVRIVEEAEYAAWARGQSPLYDSVRGTDDDPFQEENAATMEAEDVIEAPIDSLTLPIDSLTAPIDSIGMAEPTDTTGSTE